MINQITALILLIILFPLLLCGKELSNGFTMSMYNEQTICLDCKAKERKRDDYARAVQADNDEIKKGNYNSKGIGLK